jgi:pentatricopeptide repeat protein
MHGQSERSSEAYAAMMDAFRCIGRTAEARGLLDLAASHGLTPDTPMFNAALRCCRDQEVKNVEQLMAKPPRCMRVPQAHYHSPPLKNDWCWLGILCPTQSAVFRPFIYLFILHPFQLTNSLARFIKESHQSLRSKMRLLAGVHCESSHFARFYGHLINHNL